METRCLASDLNTLGSKKTGSTDETTAPWAVRRVVLENFVENPGIVGVEVIGQLTVARFFGDVFNSDPFQDRVHFSAINFRLMPCVILDPSLGDVFLEEFVVVAFPVSLEADCGCQDERDKSGQNSHSMLLDPWGVSQAEKPVWAYLFPLAPCA